MSEWIIDGLEVIAKRRGKPLQQGDVLIVEAAIKALKRGNERYKALQDALVMIDSWMQRGDLGGDGCDKNATRNGMVLAYNLVYAMRDGTPQELGPHRDEHSPKSLRAETKP